MDDLNLIDFMHHGKSIERGIGIGKEGYINIELLDGTSIYISTYFPT